MSMVDLPLMDALLAALKPGCRLVMVGDPDQLPSVGPGNVLGDILRSGAVDSVTLTEVFRQAEQSAIIRSAHAVNRGQAPDLSNKQSDFFFLCRRSPDRLVQTVVDLCRTRLPDKMGIPAGPTSWGPMRPSIRSASPESASCWWTISAPPGPPWGRPPGSCARREPPTCWA